MEQRTATGRDHRRRLIKKPPFRKQSMRPSIDKWTKKMRRVHTMEFHSAIKKNETLPFATTWMDGEGILLSERSQRKTNAA